MQKAMRGSIAMLVMALVAIGTQAAPVLAGKRWP